ncbi:MAG: hypothetical protein U9Q62_05815 [Campylobacterota bacterium]|nr:hypothetical protein [Campylobacterota bacterium]
MVELGLALLKTLASFLFDQYLYSTTEYDIDNAPSWYYQESADEMCAFTYEYGKLESIEKAKTAAQKQMQTKISQLIDRSIYQHYKNSTTPKEDKMLEYFSKDVKLPIFVDSNLHYVKVKHEDNADITFVKACIPKQTILTYQTERLKNIQKELSIHRSDEALKELDREFE